MEGFEGQFRYKIGDIEREFNFGNYALEQTLEEMQASVSDLSDLLNRRLLVFLRTFIYHAATYPLLKEGKEVDFKPFDVHEWIDQTGGTQGDFVIKASKCIYAALGVSEATEEKKSNLKKAV